MRNQLYILFAVAVGLSTGCRKLIGIDPPKNTITTEQMFADNTQAEWAVAGLYSKMIHGTDYTFMDKIAETSFAGGLCTVLGSFSSDEMYNSDGPLRSDLYYLNINQLTTQRAALPANAWKSAYKVIYDANAVLEGLDASPSLLDSVRKQLWGEALTIRAFAYFYLVNFFGDVPLALTIEYTRTGNLSRSPVAKVYEQIIKDLVEARLLLAADFSVGKDERVRANSWFAEALLARVYLYTGSYQDAVNSANKVIGKTDYFSLEPDLSNVFATNSREAILQLKPTNADLTIKNGTPEGYTFRPFAGFAPYRFTDHFLDAFGTDDKRKTTWIAAEAGGFTPYKYTVGPTDGEQFGIQPQYYMVMRLAEVYLIRAEASLLLSEANKGSAIDDLNALRSRAGLDELPQSLTAAQVSEAIANERRFELFAEWGHRWLDLKRTGKAKAVLSQIASKQPWAGDYQLLYPIPATEIINNKNITQNTGYDVQ